VARRRKPAEGPITLRNLPEPVARAVRERAVTYNTSLNRAVIGMLEEATGTAVLEPRDKPRDLSEFFGILSPEEADAMTRTLAEQRRIDSEMWE
jgi:hypothetical protein